MQMLLTLALAATTVMPGGLRPLPEAYVEPDYRFNGLDRPLMVEVVSPRSFGPMKLALMDAEGRLMAEMVDVEEGPADLASLFPGLWNVRETCFVQLLKRGEAAGSAMVLVPMLSRMVPVTTREPHPAYGYMHTKIVGWRDEFAPEPDEAPDPAGGSEGDETPGTDEPAGDGEDVDATTGQPGRFFTGFRAYVERDVLLRTTHGDIRLAMSPGQAPNTVQNFLDLCAGGFYRDIIFHRIVPLTTGGDPFVIQAGDPTGIGDGGPGYWLPIEPSELPHDFGVISMARDDDPDTAGSQIFICLSREGTARLDGQYCAFGYAVDGADVITSIAAVELADIATGRPANPPVIEDAELIPAPPRTPGVGRPDRRVERPEARAPKKPGRVPR